MPKLKLAWWNLENLFDQETAVRDEELGKTLKNELKGWTKEIRDKKISQLSKVIKLMFEGEGPDLLGVCEVESEAVTKLLSLAMDIPDRDYKVVTHDSPDARGIDVSFIVDQNTLTVLSTNHQVIVKRTATRDIFWIRLRVNETGSEFVAVANHWPSRTAGQYLSEPFRMLTGETHACIISKFLDKEDGEPNLPIISMGDYNDEPFNRSLREYTLGTRDPGRVRYSKSGHLLNLMWPLMRGHDPGTYLYKSDWNMLDQFLVSYGMLRGDSPIRVNQDSVIVFKPDFLVGQGGKPRRFNRPSAKTGIDEEGYSDHFPITVELKTS